MDRSRKESNIYWLTHHLSYITDITIKWGKFDQKSFYDHFPSLCHILCIRLSCHFHIISLPYEPNYTHLIRNIYHILCSIITFLLYITHIYHLLTIIQHVSLDSTLSALNKIACDAPLARVQPGGEGSIMFITNTPRPLGKRRSCLFPAVGVSYHYAYFGAIVWSMLLTCMKSWR